MAQPSAKREQIEKSMSTMITTGSVAIFLLIFCLFSSHALWDKLTFQNKVISDKTTARNQLNEDLAVANKLDSSYEKFNNTQINLLGNAVTGEDNDNAKIVLDALPNVYDYPALTTSLQNLLSNQGVAIDSIGGTDESATIGKTTTSTSPIAMPFTFSVDGPYQNIQNIINTFERSIRPFQFQTLTLSGDSADVSLTVSAQTFFQPAKKFTITTEKVQ